MKKVLCLFLLLSTTVAFAQEEEIFVYSENNKRDPFLPLVSEGGSLVSYDAQSTSTDMVLEGIVLDAKGNNLAILNGKIIQAGDQAGDYTVESILNDSVNLVKDQEHLTIRLKKEVLQ